MNEKKEKIVECGLSGKKVQLKSGISYPEWCKRKGMKKTESPCYECARRSPACHDRCDDYKKYRQALDEAKERDREHRRVFEGIQKHNGC